jgi:hypothetical protein
MTAYALVRDNEVVRVGLPTVWRNADGTTTSGFNHLDDASLREEGWLPIDDHPAGDYNPETQMVTGPRYDVLVTKVHRYFDVVDRPPPSPEEVEAEAADTQLDQIRAKAQAVFNGTDTFTAAQMQKLVAAMVLRMTR